MTDINSDNSREWAAQAYALLKKRQEEQKQELEKQEEQKQELKKQEEQKQELEKQEEQKQELIDIPIKENIPVPPQTITESELGEFDDNFTWSAMILAAQGKKPNQISIDEIDWLTKLRSCLLYTSPSPRDISGSRMPSSA